MFQQLFQVFPSTSALSSQFDFFEPSAESLFSLCFFL